MRVEQQGAGDSDTLFLPAAEGGAALAHGGVIALWERQDEIMGGGSLGGAYDFFLGGVGFAKGDILADGAGEQGGLLEHDADLGAQRFDGHVADIVPVDQDAPFAGVVEARQQVDDAGLARACGAQQGDGLAGASLEVDIFEHGLAAAHVAEGDVFKLDGALDGGHFDCPRLVGHIAVRIQDFENALGGGGGLSELGDDEAELGDGEEQVHQVQAELLPLAQGERAGDDLAPTGVQDGGLTQVGDQEDQREEEGKQACDGDLLGHDGVGGLVELGLLARFTREGLDHLDAGQVLLQDGVEGGDFLLHLGEQGLADGAEEHEQHQRHRHDPQGDQRQAGIGGEDDDQGAAEQDDRPDQLQQALADEHTQLFDIVGGADHQLPGLVAVVVREGQALDFGVQVVAQVEGDALRVALGPVGLQEGEHAAQDGEEHDGNAGLQHGVGGVVAQTHQVIGKLLDAPTGGQLEEFQYLGQRLADKGGGDLGQVFEQHPGAHSLGDGVDDVAHHARHG